MENAGVENTGAITGLVPGVGVLLFEADFESDSDSGQEPGLGEDSHSTPLNVWIHGLSSLCHQYAKTNAATIGETITSTLY